MENDNFIKIKNLSFDYENSENPFLRINSLSIPEKKITAVLGPNGSGKSTFLKLLCRINRPLGGAIFIGEKNALMMKPGELAKNIAFVPQSRAVPDILVKNLVLHGRFPYANGVFGQNYSPDDKKIALAAMETMGIQGISERNMKNLSGGQRQKVYLALALAQSTPILVLDEPLSFLDIRQQLELAETLKHLGKTTVLVMHDIPLALDFAENIIVFEDGKIAGTGSPKEIFDSKILEKVFGVKMKKEASIRFYLC